MSESTTSYYYNELINFLTSASRVVCVSEDFHSQICQIRKMLRNDKTAMINTILDFMVQSACTDIKFQTTNSNLNKTFEVWKNDVNSNVSIDIPRGLRSLSEQYFRERWSSSFIVLNINWGKINGYTMPVQMWFSDGGSVYAKNKSGDVTQTKYYIGKPKSSDENLIKISEKESRSVLIRKPYNVWYDLYPTPYLVKKGALYHGLFKTALIEKQLESLFQLLPAMLAVKMGSAEAMRNRQNPAEADMKKVQEQFIKIKEDAKNKSMKDLIATLPYDVDVQNVLPDLLKITDDKIFNGVDKNLLMALGLIEFKGFSTNREESVLNPKPLVEEITDGVLDWVELLDDVVYMIQQKNEERTKYSKKEIRIVPGVIKSLVTDNMRVLMRAIYDRGLISKESALENTTALDFEIEVQKRSDEKKRDLNNVMYPPIILNQEQNQNEPSGNEEPITPEKKKAEPDLQAYLVGMTTDDKDKFLADYNKCVKVCNETQVDEELIHAIAMDYAKNPEKILV
jgi:hypothetical protein